jgi:hypothetical protein
MNEERASEYDQVNHPRHYTTHPSGVECITITEHLNFNLGNAIKYIWRAGEKDADELTDLRKARWYVSREIYRREALYVNTKGDQACPLQETTSTTSSRTTHPIRTALRRLLRCG